MKNWVLFGTLGLIWGSSFLLIKIGVQELDAFSLVAGRLTLAAVAFGLMLYLTRRAIPRDWRTLGNLTINGIGATALPFVLITWGEQYIDSGLTGILNSTTPLFSLVIAHLALRDDRITLGKLLGLIAGFTGVLLLAARGMDPAHPNPIEGQLAVLGASFCYAASAVHVRRNLRHLDPPTVAGFSLMAGALIMLVLTLMLVRPLPVIGALSAGVVLAVISLALFNTFIANLMYYTLIENWGASRATMVTYLVGPASLVIGALLGSEVIDARLVIGAVLIVGGIALANMWRGRRDAQPAAAVAGLSNLGYNPPADTRSD